MSTLSSSLNSSAAAAVADFYLPWQKRRGRAEDSRRLLSVSRRLTVAFGVLQIMIGIGASWVSESVVSDALTIAGFTAGILLGVFALGVLTKTAHQRGVLVGMVCGIIVLSWIKFGTGVAWTWLAVIGAVATFTIGVLASWIIPVNRSMEGAFPEDGAT